MRFLRIPKDQLIVALTLGSITGYYVWAEPVKQYMQENNHNNNNKSQKMAKSKQWLSLPVAMALCMFSLAGLSIGYRVCLHRHVIHYKRKDAEEYANFLYEKFKEKEKANSEMNP